MRERARTVIVGGGPAANALAVALTAGGDRDVLVLDPRAERADRDVPTARFGAVLQAAHRPADVALARDSVAILADLARDDDAAWRAVGSLEVATTQERLAALRGRAAVLTDAGVAAEVLDARGAAARLPALDPAAILGALHVPTDGVADRAAVGAALARRASAAGVTSAAGVRVTGVRVVEGRVTGVETDAGPVACERLVLASCTASVRIAALAGITLPIASVARPIRVTAPIVGSDDVGAMPVVRHPDAAFAIRARGDVLALAGHGDPSRWADAAARLLPAFAEAVASVASVAAPSDGDDAVVTMTPDGVPIVGAHAGLAGLWILAGARLALLPALADALAARLLDARPRHALGPADPNRWYPFEAAPQVAIPRATALAAAAHAIVGVIPDELPPRRLRLSPITRRAEELGASWTAVAGWEVPRWYASNGGDRDAAVAAERRAAREEVAIADRTPLAKFDLEGPDALAVIARALPDLPALEPGILHVAVPPAASPIADVTDLVVVRKGAALVRVVAPARDGQRVLAWLRSATSAATATTTATTAAAHVVERTGSLFAIGLVGPRAERVLAAVADTDVSTAGFPEGTARSLSLGPVTPVWAHRGRTTSDGVAAWTLFGQFAMGEAAWDLLRTAGDGRPPTPLGLEASEDAG